MAAPTCHTVSLVFAGSASMVQEDSTFPQYARWALVAETKVPHSLPILSGGAGCAQQNNPTPALPWIRFVTFLTGIPVMDA